ncbi:hypothetical protein, conserved in T.vivax [Trypanosoma vivax Y486]|uniref:Uncharacterized protein n=1 Tax=Trypanosoma vivax (strain Y486) TaxID=1055687 RepID=F9WVE4_TRYVY|nr:hypothetical protein, conserved in T.vivax [Trypanosoma vivax Y486]|eukprot:CCD21552.1 hypothetical protein, conserved in T.vivax [Trypanosoma vivax Y486]
MLRRRNGDLGGGALTPHQQCVTDAVGERNDEGARAPCAAEQRRGRIEKSPRTEGQYHRVLWRWLAVLLGQKGDKQMRSKWTSTRPAGPGRWQPQVDAEKKRWCLAATRKGPGGNTVPAVTSDRMRVVSIDEIYGKCRAAWIARPKPKEGRATAPGGSDVSRTLQHGCTAQQVDAREVRRRERRACHLQAQSGQLEQALAVRQRGIQEAGDAHRQFRGREEDLEMFGGEKRKSRHFSGSGQDVFGTGRRERDSGKQEDEGCGGRRVGTTEHARAGAGEVC